MKLDEFSAVRSSGLIAMVLEPDDELVRVLRTNGEQDVILLSHSGLAIRFSETEIRASSRNSGSIRGLRLTKKDSVVAAAVAEPGVDLLIVSEHGYAKRTPVADFPTHGRGGGGVKALTVISKNGPIATARIVHDGDEVMVISENGLILRTPTEGISRIGRTAQGVILMNLDDADKVAAVAIISGGSGGNDDGENGNDHVNGNGNGNGRLRKDKTVPANQLPLINPN